MTYGTRVCIHYEFRSERIDSSGLNLWSRNTQIFFNESMLIKNQNISD